MASRSATTSWSAAKSFAPRPSLFHPITTPSSKAFGGQRLTFFDTTAEAHAVDSAGLQSANLPARHEALAQRPARGASFLSQRRWRPRLWQGFPAALHRAGRWRIHRRIRDVQGLGGAELRVPSDRAPPAPRFPPNRQSQKSQCTRRRHHPRHRDRPASGWIRRPHRRLAYRPAARPPGIERRDRAGPGIRPPSL